MSRRPCNVYLWAVPCLLLLVACGEEAVAPEKILRPVRYQVAALTSEVSPEIYAGVAQAGEEARLSFRVSGTVSELQVALGDKVPRGRVLASLDATDFELQVDQGAATLAQAEAALRRSEADYDRARSLYENQNASKADLDASRAGAESARAQVNAAQKSLDQAKRQVAYTRLKAPISGNIASLNVERNENVQAGQVVVLLTSLGRPEVRVAVPEILVDKITKGMATSIRFDAIPDRVFTGTVSEVAAASVDGSTFDVLVLVDEEQPGVRSGMAADVAFHLPGEVQRMVLPQLAIGEDSQGTHVYVLETESDGDTATARRQSVEVGDFQAEGLEVLSGLEPGTKVVTAGVRRLSDGMQVRVLEEWGGDKP